MPGTWTDFEVDEDGQFVRAFLCLEPCQYAFGYCLPIMALDACHVRNEWKGVVLAACSLDGAGELVPIAFGVAPIKDGNNWEWFVQNLKMAGPMVHNSERPLVVISDREKGIYNATTTNLPYNHHAYSVKHIEKNLKNRFKVKVQCELWSAAKTTSRNVFDSEVSKMRGKSPEVVQYMYRSGCVDKTFFTLAKIWPCDVECRRVLECVDRGCQRVTSHSSLKLRGK